MAEEKDEPEGSLSQMAANIENGTTAVATKEPNRDDQHMEDEKDDFGLPVKPKVLRSQSPPGSDSESDESQAYGTPHDDISRTITPKPAETNGVHDTRVAEKSKDEVADALQLPPTPAQLIEEEAKESNSLSAEDTPVILTDAADKPRGHAHNVSASARARNTVVQEKVKGQSGPYSENSHQSLAPKNDDHPDEKGKEDEWKDMPAFAPYDMYDDDDRLFAREEHASDNEDNAYTGLGGAGKGYTRIQLDEDAKSVTSMDENTNYLFKSKTGTELHDEDEDQRDPLAQLQNTKTLLSEAQRIAYVGLTRLAMAKMVKDLEDLESSKKTKKEKASALESMRLWSQKVMVRLYGHMDISSSEQIMIEQLQEHGVEMADLTPVLMLNARVKNPMAEENADEISENESKDHTKLESTSESGIQEQIDGKGNLEDESDDSHDDLPAEPQSSIESSSSVKQSDDHSEKSSSAPPNPEETRSSLEKPSLDLDSPIDDVDDPVPEYKEREDDDKPEDMSLAQLGTDENIDIDLRWTVLCDLFLVLIIDSDYDSRSRILLERAGEALQVSWVEISRFEKRVTDSLEMREAANRETWDEAEHLESRRKRALRRRYLMMGLATVGGSLVIGISAGALAPVIGAGLAAGFTTIGVTGTSAALTGAGASAIITTGALGIGGSIGLKASHRRTGAVKTFEYRPLHNNKRVNLIVTISGWMTNKADDVRLPFSTIDPIMGDIYSVLWEPEMLTSMGDTINILASEALTQTIQQVLGSTILITLMAAIQLPIVLSKLSYLIDNPWTVSMARANAAGLILADSLIDRNLGTRPITLVGFSLGARVIFGCLRELSNRGAYGIIQNVYMFGSPIIANKDEYCRARSVVSGRFVNGYATNDWILGYLFRATGGGIMRVAGLAKVEGVTGIENFDVTEFVTGHMAYRTAMPKILRRVGWEVESDEFAEIEDPDPENHAARQRELLKEIDEARKAAEGKPQKKRFGFFNMGKLTEKKKWEIYNEKSKEGEDDFSTTAAEGQANVLFDIEAIKKELASEHIDVTQLESTLPPMKLSVEDFKGPDGTQKSQPDNPLRETQGRDGTNKPDTNTSKFVSFFGSRKSSEHPASTATSSIGSPPLGSPSISENTASRGRPLSGRSSPHNGENPFNRGYDDYDFPSEKRPGLANAEHGKISFEELEKSSSNNSLHFDQREIGRPLGSPLRQEIEKDPIASQSPPSKSVTPAQVASSTKSPILEHNAWANGGEDDEEVGKDEEISMTFG